MDALIYRPQTANVATNLWQVNAANLTGDISHVIEALNSLNIKNAERITIQVDWASLNALDSVFKVETRCDNELGWVNENTDESSDNPTQKTLATAVGSKIFHLVPANWQGLNLVFDRNSVTVGTISVSVIVKF